MGNRKNGSESSRRAIVGILFISIVILGDIISGAIGIASPALPIGNCSPSNQLCDQIIFDQSVFGNTTLPASSMTSTSWTATLNETLVVIADSNAGGVITSITDTGADTFTRQMLLSQNPVPSQNFEIWTAKTKASTGTVSTITVTWNFTTNNAFVMSSYLNVAGIGNSTSKQSPTAVQSMSLNFMPAFSGSKIVGGTALSPSGVLTCNTIVAGTFLTQRKDTCSKNVITPEVEVDVEDNMTVLRNTQPFTYSASWPGQGVGGAAFQTGVVELIGFDKEPSFPNFANFCTTSNGLCVTTQYFMNWVNRGTGANALNQVLAPGTTYCTGITTAALTTGSNPKGLEVWGSYGGVSLNTTGLKVNVGIIFTTTAPQTTFGTGASCVAVVGSTISAINFDTSGALSAANAYTSSLTVASTFIPVASTVYYAFIIITPYGFTGHANFDQVVNQIYSTGTIQMLEIK